MRLWRDFSVTAEYPLPFSISYGFRRHAIRFVIVAPMPLSFHILLDIRLLCFPCKPHRCSIWAPNTNTCDHYLERTNSYLIYNSVFKKSECERLCNVNKWKCDRLTFNWVYVDTLYTDLQHFISAFTIILLEWLRTISLRGWGYDLSTLVSKSST